MWWTNIVRVRGSNGIGSGVFISPRHVLTAAHVVTADSGLIDDPSSVSVEQIHGPRVALDASSIQTPTGWANSPIANDLCVIRVPAMFGAGLNVVPSFGSAGKRYEVAIYGYPGAVAPGNGPGKYYTGSIQRTANSFSSSDLAVAAGVSGAPILDEENGIVRVIGVVTDAAAVAGQFVSIGLPISQSQLTELTH